jgi:hypothetical protein
VVGVRALACRMRGAGSRWTMRPRIDRTQFGSVTIGGKVYEHDVLIRLDGQVEKREKKLSKAVYGTSHTISLAEARHVYQQGPRGCSSALARTARSCCRRRRPPTSSATAAGWSCCHSRSHPGLEPGRGRRHRPAPRDLLGRSLPVTSALQDRSIATGGPCRTEVPALPHRAWSAARFRAVSGRARVAAGEVLRRPPRSPPAAPRTDGRRGSGTRPAPCPPGPTAGPGRARARLDLIQRPAPAAAGAPRRAGP